MHYWSILYDLGGARGGPRYSFVDLFQEEHPPILSNFGMGSILVNYYRKKNDKDEHVPKVRRIVSVNYFRPFTFGIVRPRRPIRT
jgi:hypothetical protein